MEADAEVQWRSSSGIGDDELLDRVGADIVGRNLEKEIVGRGVVKDEQVKIAVAPWPGLTEAAGFAHCNTKLMLRFAGKRSGMNSPVEPKLCQVSGRPATVLVVPGLNGAS